MFSSPLSVELFDITAVERFLNKSGFMPAAFSTQGQLIPQIIDPEQMIMAINGASKRGLPLEPGYLFG